MPRSSHNQEQQNERGMVAAINALLASPSVVEEYEVRH